MPNSNKQPPKTKKSPPQYVGGATPYAPPEDGIGGRIKAKRTELNLNVEELARLTESYDYRDHGEGKGISASMLRRYEYKEGGSNPGAREICLLCDALDVSADWLVRGIEPRNEETGKRKTADAMFNAVSSVLSELQNPLAEEAAKRKTADALFNAVSSVFSELLNPFSGTSLEQKNDQWKIMERTTKLNDARQPNKQAK